MGPQRLKIAFASRHVNTLPQSEQKVEWTDFNVVSSRPAHQPLDLNQVTPHACTLDTDVLGPRRLLQRSRSRSHIHLRWLLLFAESLNKAGLLTSPSKEHVVFPGGVDVALGWPLPTVLLYQAEKQES